MSSLQSVPFLPLGDLSKISWLDDLLYSWHQGVNYYHYNIVLCSAGWESKLNMPWLCHPCQMSRRLPLLPHTVLFTQPSQKITSSRIFYFNHYLLIKNLSKKFCQFLKETFQDLQSCHFSFKCHCLRKCSRGQNLWSTDLAETWHRSWLSWDISKANLAHFSDFKF